MREAAKKLPVHGALVMTPAKVFAQLILATDRRRVL
jgi:hypothetical protein